VYINLSKTRSAISCVYTLGRLATTRYLHEAILAALIDHNSANIGPSLIYEIVFSSRFIWIDHNICPVAHLAIISKVVERESTDALDLGPSLSIFACQCPSSSCRASTICSESTIGLVLVCIKADGSLVAAHVLREAGQENARIVS